MLKVNKTKKCRGCRKTKPIKKFSTGSPYCKRCVYEKTYKIGKWLDDIKIKSGCIACEYSEHPSALVFHHKNPKEKSFGFCNKKKSKEVLQEIEKCVVLCANCHTLIHCSKYRNLPKYIINLKKDLHMET